MIVTYRIDFVLVRLKVYGTSGLLKFTFSLIHFYYNYYSTHTIMAGKKNNVFQTNSNQTRHVQFRVAR